VVDVPNLLDALRREGQAAARAADGRLELEVPHLDWTVREVLGHLGGVHRRFARSLQRQTQTWPGRATVDPPGQGLVGWARAALAELVAAIRSADLDSIFVTWAGPRDGTWVLRRVANETAVHRWDIESAGGTPAVIAPPLAEEIIEEFLTVIVHDRGLAGVDDAAAHAGATLHLHGTDGASAEWYLTVVGGGLEVERRHDKGDVAMRGSACDLALWLNGRIPASRLDAFGEPSDIDWWSRAFRFD
jgi:uncharacterized protein (TIGR03083 family)